LDFGSQYTQVIARRVRECNVYSIILRYDTPAAEIAALKPKRHHPCPAGRPAFMPRTRRCRTKTFFALGVPMLGICYGVQLFAQFLGGKVEKGQKREYGKGTLTVKDASCALFADCRKSLQVWNSHGDKLTKCPRLQTVAVTENSEFAAIENRARKFFGLQFHPEVVHTPRGREIIANFVHGVCGCGKKLDDAQLRRPGRRGNPRAGRQGKGHSRLERRRGFQRGGGAAAQGHRRPAHLHLCQQRRAARARGGGGAGGFRAPFQDQIAIRKRLETFSRKLKGVTDPERKRKIIGKDVHRSFQRGDETRAGKAKFLAQGTLYPDVIESVPIAGNPAALIKSHHNVGGLPKNMKFKLVEPLKCLFKDEVRQLGLELGLPKEIVFASRSPARGLAVRILGEVTPARCEILRNADAIVVEEMKASGWYYKIWQSFAVLLPVRSVGVMGDERTYDYTIAIRAVESQDGMTADWVKLPYDLAGKTRQPHHQRSQRREPLRLRHHQQAAGDD
jgi:GMP synthase (glutamine-hydrolysing)